MQRKSGESRAVLTRVGFGTLMAVLFASLSIAGCVQTPKQSLKPNPTAAASQSVSENPLEFNDSCAAQMHEIEGAMLQYYALNRRLPEHLQDLASFAEVDQPLVFTCPVSHQPYVYVPEGLPSPSSDRRLVLYDAVPAHKGARWAILMRPASPGQVPAAWVVQLTDPMLQLYVPTNVPPLK